VLDSRVAISGAIRQELLSGIKEHTQFEDVRERLRAFPDAEVTSSDYEEVAALSREGRPGSSIDFLICAVAARNEFSIFTTDEDFTRFARILPIVLHGTHR
jgi:predicted nucleic acid-binding protein